MRVDLLIDMFFNMSLWARALPHLLSGLKMTLFLAGVTMSLAMPVGLLLAAAGTTRVPSVRWLVSTYVDVVRAWPPLVLLILIYSALPFVGVRFSAPGAAILALTLLNG
ncbi:MAG: ABC transporter permease subunit, partial [Gammaproteobacteria bacterium]